MLVVYAFALPGNEASAVPLPGNDVGLSGCELLPDLSGIDSLLRWRLFGLTCILDAVSPKSVIYMQ